MKLKEINHTAMPSWSPAQHHPIYLATGTSAQQLDASFSTSASLEFFKLDLADPSLDMKSCGSFPSSHRYHKLVWSPHGLGGQSHPSGVLIAGGENGNVILYDPAKIMAGDKDVVIAQSDIHTGPVRALDINPFQTNLVASGGNESEIYIWDMNNFGSPMTPGPKTQPLEDISCVAWNRQVQHILSSSSPSGRTSVWDLRKNDLIIKVSDHSNRMHCSGMAWNPEVATQLVVASEDDRMPVIQMWDLRFASSPLKILENHTRGILAIAWSLADPDLLLSCGKDSRILCWNPNTGEVLYELPTTNQWCFDIQWCPRNPAVLSAAGFDGHINIHSIMGGTSQAQNQTNVDQISTSFGNMDPFGTGQTLPPLQLPQSATPPATVNPLKKPPKWIRRPVGASFAFGGKLVSMENAKPSPQQSQQPTPPVVHVSQVVTETAFLKRSDQLQATLGSGRFVEFCLEKIDAAENAFEKTVWSFLKANFDSDTRSSFLELLGYNKEEVALKISAALTEKPAQVDTPAPAPCKTQPIADLTIAPPVVTPEAVFDLIAASNLQPTSTLELNFTPETESKETLQIDSEEKSVELDDPIGETEEQEAESLMEEQEEEILLEEVTGPTEEESGTADILAPSEDALVCPTEEALQSPFEEIIQDASEEAPQCPVGEILQCPSEGTVLCPTEDALVCPTEDALVCPTEDALQSPFEEVLQLPSVEAPQCLVGDILQCPFEEAIQDPTKEAILCPNEEALLCPSEDAMLSPFEEVLQVPSQEAPQCPIEETILCPSVEVLQSPFVEVNQDLSDGALPCPIEEAPQSFSEELVNPCKDVSECLSDKVVPCPFDEIVQCPSVEASPFDELVNPSEYISQCLSEEPIQCPSVEVPEASCEEAPQVVAPADSVGLSISRDVDGLITQALLTGDFEGAVELCLHDNRMADSIILAIAGGADLLEKTQKMYFTKSHSKLTKLISAVVMKDWHDVLNTCELQNWKEALAAVMTYAQPQEFTSLCDLLGARLEAANDSQLQAQACLCYICAGNVEKLVSCWTKAQGGSNPLSLQDVVEKVVVMRHAVEQTQSSGPVAIGVLLAEKMSQYANLLASQGSLATALTYLPDETDQICVQQLRERLSYALGQKAAVPAPSPPSQAPQPQPQPIPAQSTHPYTPVQPNAPAPAPAPAPAQPQYYQPVRAASTVTSWSNQTPTAFPHVPTPLPISTTSDQPKVEHPNSMYGMPAPGTAAAPPASTTPSYMYSQQYQHYPQMQPYPPQGGVSVYQPLQFSEPSSPPPPPPGFIPQYSVPSQTAYPPPPQSTQPFSPTSNPPFFPTSSSSAPFSPSSAAPFQHGGPGSPGSFMPPPSGVSGTQHDPELIPASQKTGPQNGWNDPPTLSRALKKKLNPVNYTPLAPITAPIMTPLGVDPQAQLQSSGPPMGQAPPQVHAPYSGVHQQPAPPPAVNQPMNTTMNPATPKTTSEGAPGAPTGDVIQPLRSMPAEKIMKKPIPDEHLVLKTTFEGLIQKCLAVATDPQTKRKLDDANKRLEALYDKLREQTLSPAIVGGLHNIARTIESRSYSEGLNIHTHIVSSSNFSETSAFMPVLKVVLTQANKLGV